MTGPRVILLSGWAHPASALQPLADLLAPRADTTCVSAADWRPDLLRSLPGRLYLAGWSQGGMLALEAAAQEPARVAGLVLIGSTARFCRAPDYPFGPEPREVRAMAASLAKEPEQTLRSFLERAARPAADAEEAARSKVSTAMAIGLDRLRTGLKYLLEADLRTQVRQLPVPILLLHGKKDVVIPWQASQWMADVLKKRRLALFDDFGHDLPVRHPEAVAEEALGFLKMGS